MRAIPFGAPIIGQEERDAVTEVLGGTQLVHGPRAKTFEHDFVEFAGGGHAVSVSSCTAGLHLAYFYRGIGPGDEVIVPAQTHVATAHAVEFTSATPVFVDAEARSGNIDLDLVEAAITPRTKAISVVHYLGLPVDMDRVNAVAGAHDLFVVEDCALAVGSRYKGVHAGLLGDVGSFSFYPVKHMTTAEGGMVLSRHPEIVARIERQRAFGVDRQLGERKMPGLYDVTMLGYNYRMNELQAALGVEQLKRVPGFLEKRAENYSVLADHLRGIDEVDVLASASEGPFQSSYYCLSAVLDDRTAQRRFDIINVMKSRSVGTSIYYPMPVPHLAYYREKYGYSTETYPVAARISNQSIALPVGPHLDGDDMEQIARTLKAAIKETSP